MSHLTAYERLMVIRGKNRPTMRDYIPRIFDDFLEMHGDRHFGDDAAVITGIARIGGNPVTVITIGRGRNIAENKLTNFGMPYPEGYRKSLRAAEQAEKFGRPIVCLIDTPGAYAGMDAENRGQGEAIAKNLFKFMGLKTPILTVITGEGGSGGALALGICDELAMLENALYSVISPRGFASILWKDGSREKEACELLKITAEDMVSMEIAENIIPEPDNGDVSALSQNIKEYFIKKINTISQKTIDELLISRYTKFRKIGEFTE